MPPAGENPTLQYALILAVGALFSLLVKQIADRQRQSDKAVDDANARTAAAIADGNARVAAANETLVAERGRYDTLLGRVVNEVARVAEQTDGLYEILSRHLEYTREVMKDVLNPPDPPPPVARPGRKANERNPS